MANDQSVDSGADTDGDESAGDDAIDQYPQSAVGAASSTNNQDSNVAAVTDDANVPGSTSAPRNTPASQSPVSQATPAYPNSSFSNTSAVAATAPSVYHQHSSIAEQASPCWKLSSNSCIILWLFLFFLVWQ